MLSKSSIPSPTLTSRPTRGFSVCGSSVGGSFVCWLRSEFGKFCEESGCSVDVELASGRGLIARVVVAGVSCHLCVWQKPVELRVLFWHLDWSLFRPLHFYNPSVR